MRRCPPAPKQNIKSAFAAVLLPRWVDGQYVVAQRRDTEPVRYGGADYAGPKAAAATLARDNQHATPSGIDRRHDETVERAVCLCLGMAMQVDARLDVELTAPQACCRAAINTRRFAGNQIGPYRGWGWDWRFGLYAKAGLCHRLACLGWLWRRWR